MERDIVFIDTSIYIEEKYFAPISRITALRKLVGEGYISIISTEITNREVLKHFKADVGGAMNYIKHHLPVLNSFDETQELSSRALKKALIDKAEKKFQDFLTYTPVLTLGYDMCQNIEDVFEKYFNREKPFAEGLKEKEFPDAFALQILENYCKKNKLKIYVLSADPDMMGYKSEYLIPTDYKDYLTKKLAEAKTLELIKSAIASDKDRICKDIEDYVIQELDDTRNYGGLFNTEEVSDIEVKECLVELEDDFSIVSEDKGIYVVELHMSCFCEIRCSFYSLDYATYDREDGKWYGGEWESETVTGESYFNVLVHYSESDGDYLDMDLYELSDAVPDMRHAWER